MGIGKCDCGLCGRMNEARRIVGIGDLSEMKKFIWDLLDNLANTEQELEHDEMILDGIWPNSVGILERALEKAKTIQAASEEEDTGSEDRDEWKHKASEWQRLK